MRSGSQPSRSFEESGRFNGPIEEPINHVCSPTYYVTELSARPCYDVAFAEQRRQLTFAELLFFWNSVEKQSLIDRDAPTLQTGMKPYGKVVKLSGLTWAIISTGKDAAFKRQNKTTAESDRVGAIYRSLVAKKAEAGQDALWSRLRRSATSQT